MADGYVAQAAVGGCTLLSWHSLGDLCRSVQAEALDSYKNVSGVWGPWGGGGGGDNKSMIRLVALL